MEEEKQPIVISSKKPQIDQKMLVIALLVAVLLLGMGGYIFMRQMTPQKSPIVAVGVTPTEKLGMFGSLKDALSKSLSLECAYTENDIKTTVYIKAGMVRANMIGTTPSQNGSVIVRDEKMYYWNGKQGMMMAFDIDAMQQEEDEAVSDTPGTMLEGLEKFKQNCKPSTIADTVFTIPTDVKFVDQTRMMESMQQMQKSVTPGQAMNEEQIKMIEKQMQQYQPSTTP